MEGIARARLTIKPDYLVVVEREIFALRDSAYYPSENWNQCCRSAHAELFARIRHDVPRLNEWIHQRFKATLYEDEFSPFCMIADSNGDADGIQTYLDEYCRQVPGLVLVRNDVYARFSHAGFNKGTALGEIARQLGVSRDQTFAAGDHFNDLPMLSGEHARHLAAPDNAIPEVKELVRRQSGYVSHQPWGHGVARALEFFLQNNGGANSS
jgi:hypothetical protein